MRIYVAGPLDADPITNTKIAIDAAEKLLQAGHVPFVPHLTVYWHMMHYHDRSVWLALGLVWLAQCEAVVRLPGESPGADLEVETARKLGLPVWTLEEACKEKR